MRSSKWGSDSKYNNSYSRFPTLRFCSRSWSRSRLASSYRFSSSTCLAIASAWNEIGFCICYNTQKKTSKFRHELFFHAASMVQVHHNISQKTLIVTTISVFGLPFNYLKPHKRLSWKVQLITWCNNLNGLCYPKAPFYVPPKQTW